MGAVNFRAEEIAGDLGDEGAWIDAVARPDVIRECAISRLGWTGQIP